MRSIAAIAIAAVTAAMAIGSQRQAGGSPQALASESITDIRGSSIHWLNTPRLPGRLDNVAHASIVSSRDRIYVALSRTRGQTESVSVWKLDRGRWIGPMGRRVWTVHPDIETKLIDFAGGPCIDPTSPTGLVRVYCLQDAKWHRMGGSVFRPTPSSIATGFFASAGHLNVVRVDIPHPVPVGNVGMGGTAETHVFRLQGTRWREPNSSDVSADLSGSQRSVGLSINGIGCVVFDSTPGRTIAADEISIRVRCPDADKWTDRLPPLRSHGSRAINNDGVAIGGKKTYIGADLFGDKRVHWDVFSGDSTGWKKTTLGVSSGYWDSQGSVYSVGPDIWSVQFDQHYVGGGYLARIFVRALNPTTGRTVQVGNMLVPSGPIYDLVSYGLAEADGWEYALCSSPNRRTRTQSIKVRRVRLPT